MALNEAVPADGFLSKDLEGWAARQRLAHADSFAMAMAVNRLGVRALHASEPKRGSEQQILVALYFARSLTHFGAAILLAERGAIASARAMIRVLCDAVFSLGACANDAQFYEELLKDDRFRQAALIDALLELPKVDVPLSEPERQKMAAESRQLLADAKADKQKRPLSAARVADKAGLIDFYRLFFVPLSGAVHSSVRDLDNNVHSTPDGNIEGLSFGPDERGVLSAIEGAVSLLFTAISFHLKVMSRPEIESEFSALWEKQKERVAKLNATTSGG